MMIYAVIDTNVLVSALITQRNDAPTRLVLDYLLSGKITPVFNDEILKEYKEVLHRPKFKLSVSLVDRLIDIIRDIGIMEERLHCEIAMPDPKDIVFFEVSMAIDSTYLVTGNIKHFPQRPHIVTPKEMIRIIESNH